jgi:hypothetical protein
MNKFELIWGSISIFASVLTILSFLFPRNYSVKIPVIAFSTGTEIGETTMVSLAPLLAAITAIFILAGGIWLWKRKD